MTEQMLLPRWFDPASLRADPVTVSVNATPDERAAIADELDLLELRSLEAELAVSAGTAGVINVTGRLDAELVQSCVVSLKPVVQTVSEAIERRFARERKDHVAKAVDVPVAAEEPPDLYGEAGIDLGAVVLEQLILGIDPYPRAEDAEPPIALDGDADSGDSPFAVLKSFGHRQGS
jgi:uncharacterized metal-binding protein YceD (DUF177 family)